MFSATFRLCRLRGMRNQLGLEVGGKVVRSVGGCCWGFLGGKFGGRRDQPFPWGTNHHLQEAMTHERVQEIRQRLTWRNQPESGRLYASWLQNKLSTHFLISRGISSSLPLEKTSKTGRLEDGRNGVEKEAFHLHAFWILSQMCYLFKTLNWNPFINIKIFSHMIVHAKGKTDRVVMVTPRTLMKMTGVTSLQRGSEMVRC